VPIPPYVEDLRRKVGHDLLWMPGVTAVVRRGDEVLLVRRADNGRWTPVTGIVDPGEEPAVAARREALEEACVEVRVDRLASVGATSPTTYPNGDRAVYLDLTFACTWVGGEAAVGDDESTEVGWFTWEDKGALPEMTDEMHARIDAAWSGEDHARFTS